LRLFGSVLRGLAGANTGELRALAQVTAPVRKKKEKGIQKKKKKKEKGSEKKEKGSELTFDTPVRIPTQIREDFLNDYR